MKCALLGLSDELEMITDFLTAINSALSAKMFSDLLKDVETF